MILFTQVLETELDQGKPREPADYFSRKSGLADGLLKVLLPTRFKEGRTGKVGAYHKYLSRSYRPHAWFRTNSGNDSGY